MIITETLPAPKSSSNPFNFFQHLDSQTIFLLGLLFSASGVVSPPIALVGGIAFGFTIEHPLRAESARLAKLLLQASVIALGFGMNLQEVVHAGRSGFLYTAISISFAMGLGLLVGKLLHIGGKASFLISAGTAICGGSAIAAITPITEANEEEISVSMGTVFLLNSVALLLFPAIGHLLHLSQNQFGFGWGGAGDSRYELRGRRRCCLWFPGARDWNDGEAGAGAFRIVPVSLFTAVYVARLAKVKGRFDVGRSATDKVKVPWFILMFCAAAALSTYAPRFHGGYAMLNHLGKTGLTAHVVSDWYELIEADIADRWGFEAAFARSNALGGSG